MRRSLLASMPALLATAALLGAQAAPARADATTAADNIVAAYVELSGGRFAGDCATAVPGRDSGKICSRLIAERDGQAAYLIGRPFSEFDRWVFVTTGETARLAGVAPLDLASDDGTVPWPATR